MKRIMLLFAVMCYVSITVGKASEGTIKGIITDAQSNDPIPFASITAIQDGISILGTTSDFDGKYTLKPLKAGKYDLEFSYVGYQTKRIEGVVVSSNKITQQHISLSQGVELKCVEIVEYKKPLIELDKTTTEQTMTRSEVRRMAVRSVNDISKTAGQGVYSRDNGSGRLNVRGQRRGNSVTFIDGVKVIGEPQDHYPNNDELYQDIADNEFQHVISRPLSTFSIDVDRAAYANARRYIQDGYLPPVSAVRIEEMINYFEYEYPQPKDEHPFTITTEYADCPWDEKRKLALIGVQGKNIDLEEAPKNNLVFLIDVSGSMASYDKLGLLKDGLNLLIDQLRDEDRISIVVYAGAAGVVLPSTSGGNKEKIKSVIDHLNAGGSTAGGEGIQLAYKIARRNFKEKGNNRVILATDGDFNVGVSSQQELVKLIEKERENGVFLSVLGFGRGNLQDYKMEQMADHGNGNYNYIDNILEAKKVLVKEMGGTLYTIAKDVKIQAEFNPKKVRAYRLIGYVNRKLEDKDFNDDKKDAGELGAGHTVTVLYEIIPIESKEMEESIDSLKYQRLVKKEFAEGYEDEVLTVKFRYKNPKESKSILLTQTLLDEKKTLDEASDNLKFSASVASFGMMLRKSESTKEMQFKDVIQLAKSSKGSDDEGYRSEFIRLVEMAELIK